MTMRRALGVALTLTIAAPAWAAPPGWISGKDPKYPPGELLIGVGKGPKQESADLDARGEIARIFESKVTSVMEDFQGAASKVNSAGKGVSVEVQAVAQFTKVTAQKTLSGIEIRERGKDGSTFYALAVLDRAQCANALTEQIEALDSKINGAVSTAEGGDKMAAFKHYGIAINLMDEREALNAMLRVCDKKGKGIPAQHDVGELSGKFDSAAGEFKLGIKVDGNGATRVRDCIMEMLGNKGYQITEIEIDEEDEDGEDESADGGDFDAVLIGKLKSEKAGEIAGSIMVRTDLSLKLVNAQTKKVIKTFTGNRKEGRRDVKQSAALSAHKLCLTEAPKIVEAIDKAFKR